MISRAIFGALFLAALHGGPAMAGSQHTETLSIVDPWARATPPGAKAAAGYLTIQNAGAASDRLVGVNSPVAGRVEIHEMHFEYSVMTMRRVKAGVEIPAEGALTLAPGGLHIMFMGLNQEFAEGGNVPVVLHFEKAGEVETVLDILAIGATAADLQTGAGDHGHGQ